ncbi:APC family permease [Microbacterium sp. W4I20]|uniref:APC family permease n=1 Tax=Microbacterium sp. W4I20 TaxID=3042262 RepID=UPI00277F68E2|nr:amino acid permease [Microbacterium sp. W4I20]MDQ0727308.1 amino acid transporter [Microbacterium sp. W4I20]
MDSSEEDRRLGELGYTQKLSRSVGGVSSFFLGFAVISATTAVFSGFGFGLSTAGPAFVWTFPLAVAVFFVWALIAADLVSKIPLSGYAYQWTSRLVNPSLGWFTGFAGTIGFISGFTGVAFVMAGYVGSLFGIEMTTPIQILISIAIVLLCVLINVYGVRLATLLNNIGVGLELVVTLGATAFILIVAFFVTNEHQSIDFLFSTGGTDEGPSPYVVVWLTSSLGCIFGLLGVEAAADIAEETKNARRTIPRTMFLALGVASVIEFFMYITFLLVIKDPDTLAGSASPIADLFAQQISPWFSKLVVALALTNILVCVLANMLVASRVVYALARDNMLPGSKALRGVSKKHKVPTAAVWATGAVSFLLLCSAFANEQTFSYIIGMSALGYFGASTCSPPSACWWRIGAAASRTTRAARSTSDASECRSTSWEWWCSGPSCRRCSSSPPSSPTRSCSSSPWRSQASGGSPGCARASPPTRRARSSPSPPARSNSPRQPIRPSRPPRPPRLPRKHSEVIPA